MELASPLSDLVKCLWGLASTHLHYIYNPKRDVNKLETETQHLKTKSDDVKATVKDEEESGGVRRTEEVENWLGKVNKILDEAVQVVREARERRIKCLGYCLPQNCWSGYQLGITVDQMLSEARELEKEKFNTTLPLPPPIVLAMPMVETIGLDASFNEVWKWLVEEQEIGVIGLYGTGGVGKTILMKRINNNFLSAKHRFEIVIWVVVSKQVNEDNIRDTIRKRLNIKDDIWERWSPDERVHHLLEVLSHKKFVLLIDDVWEELDLSKIGVFDSCPRNGSKVVFTTRMERLCRQMKANTTYRVELLRLDEARRLFENNVGKSTVHSHQIILELAENIVRECKGLPLALVTIGKAMAGKDDLAEWRDALAMLKSKPHELSGMVGEVYHILELSYDSLSDATRQACFLYCCCFPKDYPIMRNELIELWIGQGLLGKIDDVYRMRDRGASILGDLKRACLLESGFDLCGQPIVKMQNVIRDMATWIARGHGQRESKLLVIEKEEDMSAEMISEWEAEQVSLWGRSIANINQTPPMCSPLKTLFIRDTKVKLVPKGFFESMKVSLKVLDLSNNKNIKSFPEEICNLVSLQYLNLSDTHISELPGEIKNLTQLRWLLFNNSILDGIVLIPSGAIEGLPLNVFSMWRRGLKNEEEMVEILRYKQCLTDLSITVQKSSSAIKIFQFLQKCIRRVWINDCKDLTRILISHSSEGDNNFSHLEVLYLQNCPLLVKMEITQEKGQENCPSLMKTEITQEKGQALNFSCFPNLVEVFFYNCGFSDLSWLVCAPKLRKLDVKSCPLLEKIIGDEFARAESAASGLFPLLEILSIHGLPNLRSICDRALSFPPGMEFYIVGCPELRKLPLDSNGDSNSKRGSFSIKGDRDWWAKFDWDPAARVTLEVDDGSRAKKMTFGEALRKIKDGDLFLVKIGFPPEPSQRG